MQTLLKNGVVIVHDASTKARGIRADVLIEGDRITRIEPNLKVAASNIRMIDCTDKIIAPGFIDTHRHMYNTALRGRHGNDVLADYVVKGILQGGAFGKRDIFWGQLAGCLECIHAGTTTVVDHSHLNYAEYSPEVAIRATRASGIRSIYGYCFTGRVDSWSPFAMNQEFIASFALKALGNIAASDFFSDGRVQLGVAFDGWFLPPEMIKDLFTKIRALGIKYVTTHTSSSPSDAPSTIDIIDECGIFSPDFKVILSHANGLSATDAAIVKKRNAFISSTPSVELQMGIGTPICFDPKADIQQQSSLGVDCHNVVLSSIVGEMRCALLNARAMCAAELQSQGKLAAKISHTVQEAYALGTIQGAKAIGMQDLIGSLEVGKKADILVFDALAPSMICAAQYDPVTAIVMHSTPGDIDMTFVDGVLRKSGGKLLPIDIDPTDAGVAGVEGSHVSWSEVAENLLISQNHLQEKLAKIDTEAAKPMALPVMGIDPSLLAASL